MGTQFNLLRFAGDLLFVASGTGIAASITLLLGWILGAGQTMALSQVLTSFLGILIGAMILALPIVALVLFSGQALKVFLPVINPKGLALMIILGIIGAGTSTLMMMMFGVPSMGEFGKYAILAAAVGGSVAGILAARRLAQ